MPELAQNADKVSESAHRAENAQERAKTSEQPAQRELLPHPGNYIVEEGPAQPQPAKPSEPNNLDEFDDFGDLDGLDGLENLNNLGELQDPDLVPQSRHESPEREFQQQMPAKFIIQEDDAIDLDVSPNVEREVGGEDVHNVHEGGERALAPV